MKKSCERAFLDAAADGDLDGVNAWLSARGDVNVMMGEKWTALLYAVAHSRMAIVRRLLSEDGVDLNATTMLNILLLMFQDGFFGVDTGTDTQEQLAGGLASERGGFSCNDTKRNLAEAGRGLLDSS
eukprot:jgi/Phyca11/511758/fgenesh2_kg.PHYCAscaffold_97_\